MDPKTLSLIKGVIDEGRANNKAQWDNARNTLGTAADAVGFVGDLAVGNANTPDNQPDVKQAAVGGAASGAAKGFKSGGIFGALAGALGGAASAGLSTAKHRQDFEETQEADFEQMMADATRMPFVGYAKEGGVSGLEVDAEIIPIQAEEGENVMLKDFSITDVKADKSHDEAEKGDVSDILPKGSVVFSSDEGSLIYKDQIDEASNLIAYKPVYYEDGHKSKTGKTERVLFTDLYKDNEDALTPAELANRIKKMYPTVDNDKDIFALDTNEQNKESRSAYLGRLIALQENKKVESGKPSMDQEYVPKFQGGGVVGGNQDPKFPVDWERFDKGAKSLFDAGWRNVLNEGMRKNTTTNPQGFLRDVSVRTRDKAVDKLPGAGWGKYLDVGMREHTTTNPQGFIPNTPVEAGRGGPSATPLSMLDEDGAKSYVSSVAQNPEQLVKDVADGKVSTKDLKEIKALGDPRINQMIDDVFSKLGGRLDQLEKRNSKNRIEQLRKANNAFRKKRGFNALRYGSAAAGVLGQSNREDPIIKSAGDVSEMFADTPESLIRTQENQARAGATANNQQLEDMGGSASQIISNNAAANASVQDSINRIRGMFENQRAQNRSKRAQVLNKVENFNSAQRTQAGNAERTNQNAAIADLFGATGNYFERGERIGDQQLGYENAIDREFNANDQVLFNDRLEMDSNRLNFDMNSIHMQNKVDAMNEQAKGQLEEKEYNIDNRINDNPISGYGDETQNPNDQPRNEYWDIPRDGRRGINTPKLIGNIPGFMNGIENADEYDMQDYNSTPILPIPTN